MKFWSCAKKLYPLHNEIINHHIELILIHIDSRKSSSTLKSIAPIDSIFRHIFIRSVISDTTKIHSVEHFICFETYKFTLYKKILNSSPPTKNAVSILHITFSLNKKPKYIVWNSNHLFTFVYINSFFHSRQGKSKSERYFHLSGVKNPENHQNHLVMNREAKRNLNLIIYVYHE